MLTANKVPGEEHDNEEIIIKSAEEILWNKLPSNATILTSLERRKLKNENSLPEMRRLLNHLGHKPADLDTLRIIHIAGSKGKGSTAAFTETILRKHGLRTALFTSPHLVHPRERLRLDGRSMDKVAFARAVINIYTRLIQAADDQLELPLPGLFRFLTLLAFDVMLERRRRALLDVAIIEVGMGGLYDCTNVVERPIVTAITSLAMEHVRQLGPTLGDIARHKAGIAKPSVPLFSVPQPKEAVTVLAETTIAGDHQWQNAALAVELCRVWWKRCMGENKATVPFQTALIAKALQTTTWPGRHQILTDTNITWYLDGAHTIESLQYAVKWFGKHRLTTSEGILLFHCSHDRSYEHLLTPLIEAQLRDGEVFTSALFVRPWSPLDRETDLSLHEQMVLYWKQQTGLPGCFLAANDLMDFLHVKKLSPGIRIQLLVTGSLYLVGDVLRLLKVPLL